MLYVCSLPTSALTRRSSSSIASYDYIFRIRLARSLVVGLKGSSLWLIAFIIALTIVLSPIYDGLLPILRIGCVFPKTYILPIIRARSKLAFYTISLFYNIGRRYVGAYGSLV